MRAIYSCSFISLYAPSGLSVRLVIMFCCLLTACDQIDPAPADFRDQYTGKYQVHEKIYSYGFPECGEPYFRERDTIISVSYGHTDSTLMVLGRDIFVDSTGWGYDYHYGLSFRNDSIFSHFMNGGLGCGQHEIYEGLRISYQP